MYEDEFWYYESHVGGTFGHAARSSKRTLSLSATTTNYNGRVVGRERSDDTFNRMFCTLCRGPKYSSDYFYYKTRSLGTMASLGISGNHAATLLQPQIPTCRIKAVCFFGNLVCTERQQVNASCWRSESD